MSNSKKEILNRLKRIEGQIKGIQRMIEEDQECKSILTQVSAARSALNSASALILENHAKTCLYHSVSNKEYEKIDELIELIQKFMK